jgi:hypothetical protein
VAVEPSYKKEKGEEKIEVIYHVFILSHGLLASYNRSRFDVIIFTNSSCRFNAFFTPAAKSGIVRMRHHATNARAASGVREHGRGTSREGSAAR